MRGSDWFQVLPDHGVEREQAILDAVRLGWYLPIEYAYFDVELTDHLPHHTVRYWVSSDVLRIGEPDDFIRVTATARTAQMIAYELGCVLPTTRICDLLYRRAILRNIELEPALQPVTERERIVRFGSMSPSMSDKHAMRVHSQEVSALAEKRGITGTPRIVCNAGVDWVLTNVLETKPLGMAASYGAFSSRAPYRTPGGLRAWQQLCTRRLDFVGYWNTVRLVKAVCRLDGYQVPFLAVAQSPELCAAISDEGPLERIALRGVYPDVMPDDELPTRPEP